MTSEDCGYLTESSLMDDPFVDSSAARCAHVLVIITRSALNFHPWATGLAAARIARVVFVDGRPVRAKVTLSPSELLWALWPSIAVHAAFDSALELLPGLGLGALTLPMPGITWLIVRWVFNQEWAAWNPLTADMAQSSEDIS